MEPFRRRPFNAQMKLGLLFLIVASLSLHYLHPGPRLSENLADGIKGCLYGLAIGTMLVGVWKSGRSLDSMP